MNGEKVIQTFLLAYLNVTDYYLARTEGEMDKGFEDLYLEPFWQKYPDVRHGYLIELKYVSRSEWSEARGHQELAAAQTKLQQYRRNPRTNHCQSVTCVALVFCGLGIEDRTGGCETIDRYPSRHCLILRQHHAWHTPRAMIVWISTRLE
ncbi:MAG: PD-(D/E)XK nuclease domain-containing protein [Candidatus Vecturithrix sp.]|nr:PD-(D/E)XK nuclease domain-containing protein [Candidatus Vecturithrix sp.]